MASPAVVGNWQGRQYIAGRWQDSGAEVFENLNPAHTSQVLGIYPRGTVHDVDQAVLPRATRLLPGGIRAASAAANYF